MGVGVGAGVGDNDGNNDRDGDARTCLIGAWMHQEYEAMASSCAPPPCHLPSDNVSVTGQVLHAYFEHSLPTLPPTLPPMPADDMTADNNWVRMVGRVRAFPDNAVVADNAVADADADADAHTSLGENDRRVERRRTQPHTLRAYASEDSSWMCLELLVRIDVRTLLDSPLRVVPPRANGGQYGVRIDACRYRTSVRRRKATVVLPADKTHEVRLDVWLAAEAKPPDDDNDDNDNNNDDNEYLATRNVDVILPIVCGVYNPTLPEYMSTARRELYRVQSYGLVCVDQRGVTISSRCDDPDRDERGVRDERGEEDDDERGEEDTFDAAARWSRIDVYVIEHGADDAPRTFHVNRIVNRGVL